MQEGNSPCKHLSHHLHFKCLWDRKGPDSNKVQYPFSHYSVIREEKQRKAICMWSNEKTTARER